MFIKNFLFSVGAGLVYMCYLSGGGGEGVNGKFLRLALCFALFSESLSARPTKLGP